MRLHHLGLGAVLFAAALGGCKRRPQPSEEAPSAPEPKKPESLEDVGLSTTALDRSVNPCEDFYAFACGGWIESTEIPSDKSRWVRSFSVIHQRNEKDLKAILEGAAESPGDDAALKKIGAFYAACMDEKKAEEAGMSPLEPLIDAVKMVKDPKSLAEALAVLHRHHVWAFFDLRAEQDFEDATKIIGNLDQNGLGLPERDYYLNKKDDAKKKIRAAYVEHVAKMLELSGFSAKEAKAGAKTVMKIETALAKASKSPVERRNPKEMYNRIDLAGVKKAAPRMPWAVYFEGLEQPELTDINVTAPKYLAALGKVAARTKPKDLQTYLRWHVLNTYATDLSQAFFDEAFAFKKVLTGQDEPRPRWKRCIAATDTALGDLLAQPFVDKRFGGDSKAAAVSYVEGISEAFGANLDKLDWMDDETKEKAKEKLSKFSNLIGYPSKWETYEYEVGDVYAANLLGAAAFETGKNLARIGEPVDRERWEMTAPTVNAYYHPLKNQMVFPAGILQPPFYAVSSAIPVNLGAMGMVVGHELTHGFDDQGSQFDGDGNLQMWWTEASRKAFEEKTQCVADQYSGYEVLEGVNLDGKLTLGENIADLGGLKLAFAAYRALTEEAPAETVDGFTPDQQFFIANAQVWCAKAKEAEMRRRVSVDPHSAPRFRVNGPMSNLSEFAEAFECAPGTPMHPEKVCAVW